MSSRGVDVCVGRPEDAVQLVGGGREGVLNVVEHEGATGYCSARHYAVRLPMEVERLRMTPTFRLGLNQCLTLRLIFLLENDALYRGVSLCLGGRLSAGLPVAPKYPNHQIGLSPYPDTQIPLGGWVNGWVGC